MARPIWTGAITFGLVSVPVAMYSATHEHEVSFHQFEKGTSDRIRYRRVNERTGKEVDFDDIVKGADVGGGDYVLLDQDELDSVAPGRSRSLDIHRFVELADIDPLYYQKTYWLGPGSDETAKVYGLLRDAMADTGRAAVGTLVMRGKEYLTAIRADGPLLVLQTMFFADEVRDPKEQLDELPKRNTAKPAELHMAQQLIDSMSGPWKPADFRDTYTDRVNKLIKAKQKGKEVTTADPAPEPTAASDLFEVLRRSVEAASKRRSGADAPAAKPAKAAKQDKAAHPAKAAKPRKTAKAAKPARAGNDLADLSKTELTQLARDLDIPGRTKLTRPDLEKAVRKAQRKAA
ncbi:Ku protein [Paractinoplanes maris]|uniref:non-homologous end joining protein Ku n=1 Tax=Paractinoplanes maris TaxID=1734446 RepID=UPI002020798B|nr:Ku protein [Actinoplanes maris]